jgi:hypothetical protein
MRINFIFRPIRIPAERVLKLRRPSLRMKQLENGEQISIKCDVF